MKLDKGTLRGVIGLVAAFAIIFTLHALKPHTSSAADYPCNTDSTATTEIDIHAGESGSEIAIELFDKGVTASSQTFFRLAVADKRAGRIAPGIHEIDMKICAHQALTQLLDSSRIGNLLAVNEGAWLSEIQSKLLDIGYSKADIVKAFRSAALPKGFSNLEGLFFPAQYSFESLTSVSLIVDSAIKRAMAEMKRAGILSGSSDFTPSQLLTISSLVQAEGDEKDFAKISQVIRNRLTKGMPLQFDSTVHYAKQSRGAVFLSTQSTLINSPFNTYKHYGLPPSPINNPGFKAMFASVNPDQGNWFYFITVAPGDTRFTDSLDEFNNWKILYKKNLRAGKFGSK